MGSLRAKVGSDRANMMGRLRSDTHGGEGECVQTVLREFPKFRMGRPNSIIKHTGHAQSANRGKGSEPGGAWGKTRGGGKVKSKWRRVPVIATKGNCVPEVQFSGSWGGRQSTWVCGLQ